MEIVSFPVYSYNANYTGKEKEKIDKAILDKFYKTGIWHIICFVGRVLGLLIYAILSEDAY